MDRVYSVFLFDVARNEMHHIYNQTKEQATVFINEFAGDSGILVFPYEHKSIVHVPAVDFSLSVRSFFEKYSDKDLSVVVLPK